MTLTLEVTPDLRDDLEHALRSEADRMAGFKWYRRAADLSALADKVSLA